MPLTYRTGELSGTGQAATEIEITPEMIAAGALALARYDSDYTSLEEGAVEIISAMLARSEAS